MPLGADQGVGALVWSPLGWGRLTGKIGRDRPIPAGSRLHDTEQFAPPVEAEQLYRVIDALEAVAAETGQDRAADRDQLAAAPPDRLVGDHRRAQRGAVARQSRRGRLGADAGAGRRARCGQRRAAALSRTRPIASRRASPA